MCEWTDTENQVTRKHKKALSNWGQENGRHFGGDIFKRIFLSKNVIFCIEIRIVPVNLIRNMAALVRKNYSGITLPSRVNNMYHPWDVLEKKTCSLIYNIRLFSSVNLVVWKAWPFWRSMPQLFPPFHIISVRVCYLCTRQVRNKKNAVSSNMRMYLYLPSAKDRYNMWRGLHKPEYIRCSHLNCNNKEWGKQQP